VKNITAANDNNNNKEARKKKEKDRSIELQCAVRVSDEVMKRG
jgi:hypothetical protein